MVDLSKELKRILDHEKLTVYGAAQLIGAETDKPIKTISAQLQRYLTQSPKSWDLICEAMEALGYEVTIQRKI